MSRNLHSGLDNESLQQCNDMFVQCEFMNYYNDNTENADFDLKEISTPHRDNDLLRFLE